MADVEIDPVIDPAQVGLVLRRLELVSPTLQQALLGKMTEAADLAREDAAAVIRAYPAKKSSRGMREALANSLEVHVDQRSGGKVTRARVVSTGRLLPAQQQALVKAMQSLEFRHPVFARGNRRIPWVAQRGMRYFDYSRLQARLPRIRQLMSEALDEATKGLQ